MLAKDTRIMPKPKPFDPDEMYLMIGLAEDADTNDRTTAIACVAHIDDALAELLRANLPGLTAKSDRELFAPGGTAPLATFGNRVMIAVALGLIAPAFADQLSQMAKIRNSFAHRLAVDSFDHEEVRDRVDQLTRLRDDTNLISTQLLIPPLQPNPSRRRCFTYAAVGAALALNGAEDVMIGRGQGSL